MPPSLRDRFRGSLLGAMVGDVAGAVVEGEPAAYVRRAYADVDAVLAAGEVPEPSGGAWTPGRYTDDTQMSLAVAEWLVHDCPRHGSGGGPRAGLDDDPDRGRALLARFAAAYEPWRRYGPGTRWILERFEGSGDGWRELARLQFPDGSFGNGSAMRAGPVGLRFFREPEGLLRASRIASATTHAHPLAILGATLQAAAVAAALCVEDPSGAPARIVSALRDVLTKLRSPGPAHGVYSTALSFIGKHLERASPAATAGLYLGTGVAAHEAVPTALYCALANSTSFERAVSDAVFLGGDSDTIASMTGAVSGALLGEVAIPGRWLAAVREETYTVERVRALADDLLDAAGVGSAHG